MKKIMQICAIGTAMIFLFTGCALFVKEESQDQTQTEHLSTKKEDVKADEMKMVEAPAQEMTEEAFAGALDNEMNRQPVYDTSSEEYGQFVENKFASPQDTPLSTFSIDVDTASYSNIRRFLNDGMLPPTDAVRIEECINYFNYAYDEPLGQHPVNVDVTVADCPWNEDRHLARVYVQGKSIDLSEAPPSNLVFLLDVSGSMDSPDKLPLVKSALLMLSENLESDDVVSIVVYAGSSGVVLEGQPGDQTTAIESALQALQAGGSTAGGEGIQLAYRIAEEHMIKDGNNRVILCTDGDFNVGVSSTDELEKLIERKRKSGVYLSVLGFGDGNIKDNKMETLADKGNGNYAYIDSLLEAKKVLVNEAGGTLFTIAKDVKIQVEFNPDAVKAYRLVGYDNRILNPEDFNNDQKDAGEMGSGHSVTVFYELILQGSDDAEMDIDDLVFQENENDDEEHNAADVDDWMYVKLRYKQPDEDESQLLTQMAGKSNYTMTPDDDFKFASAVAEFGLLLKDSEYAGEADYDQLIQRAKAAKGADNEGYRAQFIQLAELAALLTD